MRKRDEQEVELDEIYEKKTEELDFLHNSINLLCNFITKIMMFIVE